MNGARVELSSATTLAAVIPSEGGRIESIIDRRSRRNLLAVYGPGGRRSDWYAGAPGGWDEMFPNDAPWNGAPAHGRLWSARFTVTGQETDRIGLLAELVTPAVVVRREYRILEAPRSGLRVDTDVVALGPTGPFLWSSHPMLAVEPGWIVRVDAATVEVDEEMSGRFARAAGRTVDMDRLTVPPPSLGWGEVLYAADPGAASVADPRGTACTRVSWDRNFFRDLWVVTVTGFDGFELGFLFEPSTSRPFRMSDAVARGSARHLERGDRVSFWTQVESLDV